MACVCNRPLILLYWPTLNKLLIGKGHTEKLTTILYGNFRDFLIDRGSGDSIYEKKRDQRRVYFGGFRSFGGYRENTPTERARACAKQPKNRLWRAGNTPSAHARAPTPFVLFRAQYWGQRGRDARGGQFISHFDYSLGGYTPPKNNYVLPPVDHISPPFDQNHIHI